MSKQATLPQRSNYQYSKSIEIKSFFIIQVNL